MYKHLVTIFLECLIRAYGSQSLMNREAFGGSAPKKIKTISLTKKTTPQ